MKRVLRGSNGRRSRPGGGSSLLFLFPHILYPLLSLHHHFLYVHGYSWVNSVDRLAEVWGGLREECKHSEIGVSEALICSCQVTAQCQLSQCVILATAVSCNHLMNLFFFFSPGHSLKQSENLCSRVHLAACFSYVHCITWCSSAFAFLLLHSTFLQLHSFQGRKQRKHARKDCYFYTYRSW